MAKTVKCRDVGFDCEGVVKGETEDETLALVAEHAKSAHGLEDVTPDVAAKVKSVMEDAPT